MQKLLERLTEPSQRALLTRTLKPYVLQLVKNEEGRFVIIFCLTNFGDEENKVTMISFTIKFHQSKIIAILFRFDSRKSIPSLMWSD